MNNLTKKLVCVQGIVKLYKCYLFCVPEPTKQQQNKNDLFAYQKFITFIPKGVLNGKKGIHFTNYCILFCLNNKPK